MPWRMCANQDRCPALTHSAGPWGDSETREWFPKLAWGVPLLLVIGRCQQAGCHLRAIREARARVTAVASVMP